MANPFRRARVVHDWNASQAGLLAKASKRTDEMNDEHLLDWLDAVADGALGMAVADFRKHQDNASLDELDRCAITMQAVLGTLRTRHGVDNAT